MIVLENLSKTYDENKTIGPFQYQIEVNTTLGVLGCNGAGKSTLFELMTGNLEKTTGSVRYHNEEMTLYSFHLKRKMGYLSQTLDLPQWLTPREILTYAASLLDSGKDRIPYELDRWDCLEFASRPLHDCSHGMQKRAALALAHLHEPEILILDEPFSGLDLIHIKNLKASLRARREAGQITILSTHIAPYVSELCDDAILIREGKLEKLENWQNSDVSSRTNMIEALF